MSRARQIKWVAFIAVDLALAAYLVFLFTVREERNVERELRELGTSRYLQATAVENVSLRDQKGRAFASDDLKGQWSLVFFGFTHCPDICPLTMAELDRFYRQLEERDDISPPQVVMVTVDPQRDNEAQLVEFLDRFHPDFRGLTGPMPAIEQFAEQLYVVISAAQDDAGHAGMSAHEPHEQGAEQGSEQRSEQGSETEQSTGQDDVEFPLDHSGHISVINPNGELYAVMRLPHRYRDLLKSYELLTGNWP